MKIRPTLSPGLAVTVALVAAGMPLRAQAPLTGYSPAAAARQGAIEADAVSRPSGESAQRHARALSRETHVAGTPAQARTRDYVVAQMRAWGMETEVRAYDVWMPHATSARLLRVSPAPRELVLHEPHVTGDRTSALAQYPTVNGYSGVGDVTAELVFVNFGLREDYATLDSLGVSVRGKVVLARYGRSFRGIKAREAERRGALAVILYSDPQDDGFVRGDVYPEGPMRPGRGVQRGSVMNGNGDPSTPGWPSTPGARRLPPAEMQVPRLPVIAIGYDNAAELLRHVRGAAVPQAWQGGLPFRYHAGPGPVRVRVTVRDDRASRPLKTVYNTFGIVRGTDLPDEVVIVGAHRDAWGPGSSDNVSGVTSVLEAARAVAELARAGQRPRRTIVFATWDAEEWGLVGSTEYVEDDAQRLLRGAVAYLNQDAAASGPRFGGGGSPSLRPVLRDVARRVPDPNGRGSVYAEWRRAAGVADSVEPAMGDPGGGSDFAGFYNHLGIPIADWSFGGAGGTYHSQYDGPAWMERFGDPGYRYHAAAGRIAAAMALRMANAEVLPYDYVEYARTTRRFVSVIDRGVAARGWAVSAEALRSAIDAFEASAARFTTARDAALVGGATRAAIDSANRALLAVERALTRPEGLRSRPWFRNLVYAADEDNGYATMTFPSVNEAIRGGDAELVRQEIADLAARYATAAAAIDRALTALTMR